MKVYSIFQHFPESTPKYGVLVVWPDSSVTIWWKDDGTTSNYKSQSMIDLPGYLSFSVPTDVMVES